MSRPVNHQNDPLGHTTLEVISSAGRFNTWMYETIEPFCSGRILEIGSGIGNISEFFLASGYTIALSDLRKNYLELLGQKFSGYPNLDNILQLDLVDSNFDRNFSPYLETFDTVFALNVVEHIENDQLAIQNAGKLLKEGGTLIILVPAYNFLYNRFDSLLGHYRRYTRKSLKGLFLNNGLRILQSRYFNLAGTIGWYVSGKILRNDTIPGGQMKLYNKLVPVFRLLDKFFFNAAGLSVIVTGKK